MKKAHLLLVLPGSADRLLATPDKLRTRAVFLGRMMQAFGVVETAHSMLPDIAPKAGCLSP